MRITAYCGCAVTSIWCDCEALQLSDEALNYIAACRWVISALELGGFDVSMHHLGSPARHGVMRPSLSPIDLFQYDAQRLHQAQIGVFEASHPSTGLGDELGVLVRAGKPVLVLLRKGAKLSNHTRGLCGVFANVTLAEYEDPRRLHLLLAEWLCDKVTIDDSESRGKSLRLLCWPGFDVGGLVKEVERGFSRLNATPVVSYLGLPDEVSMDYRATADVLADIAQKNWDADFRLLPQRIARQTVIVDFLPQQLQALAQVCRLRIDEGDFDALCVRLCRYLEGNWLEPTLLLVPQRLAGNIVSATNVISDEDNEQHALENLLITLLPATGCWCQVVPVGNEMSATAARVFRAYEQAESTFFVPAVLRKKPKP